MDGNAAIHDMIARLRGLDKFADEVALEAAPLIQKALRGTASAGQDPDGKPWPAKKDGSRPLLNAASHIDVEASGSTVLVTLSGPDVWHQRGTERGVPRRPIIPDAGDGHMPASILEACQTAAQRVFDRRLGGQ